jgi:hypothetical protein
MTNCTSRQHCLYCLVILFSLLSACAAPSAIDISQSAYLVRTSVEQGAKPSVASVEVQNDAPPPVPATNPAFSSSFVPVGANLSDTVASDLNAYFAGSTTHVAGNPQKVVIRIEKAEAYSEEPVSAKLPFVGLFTLGANREFFMNLRVAFEVEENGKVVKTLTVNERFSIPDGKGTDVNTSYQRLIEQYRERFFAKLDKDFLTRYLN